MKKTSAMGYALMGVSLLALALPGQALAEKYRIDPAHSFIEFSILHLGFSELKGRFNTLSGSFEYDEAAPADASVTVEVQTGSVDSNHAERDKHLRSGDFLDMEKHPVAGFVSTGFAPDGGGGELTGKLTLHGVTRELSLRVEQIGAGNDPWGGFRRGFKGTTTLVRSDYGMDYNLGPKSAALKLSVYLEGIRE